MQKQTSEQAPAFAAGYSVDNPEELARNLLKAYEAFGMALSGMIERADSKSGPFSAASEMSEASKTFADISRLWMADPARLAEAQSDLVRGYTDLWNKRQSSICASSRARCRPRTSHSPTRR